jgi:hypothetical protein
MYFNRKTADGFPIDDTGFFVIIKSGELPSPKGSGFPLQQEGTFPDSTIHD